jgi:hypothetical protein
MVGAAGAVFFASPVAPPPQPDKTNAQKIIVHNIAEKNDFIMFYLL